jgi:4-azaleucine resistance transporter AzlC
MGGFSLERGGSNTLGIKDGFVAGFPLIIGYFPIAVAFGILAKTIGISLGESALFSLFVYAGASQFMALNLLAVGAGAGEIILTTLLVNFRHFLMSASLTTRFTKDMKKWFPLIAFGVTDEVFSVASFKEEQLTTKFIMALQIAAYASWVTGSIVGYLVGQVLPSLVKDSMGIALYAMFAALLIPEAKKSTKVLIMALLSGLLNTALNYFKFLPQGWNLILSIVLISLLGSLIFKEEVKNSKQNFGEY